MAAILRIFAIACLGFGAFPLPTSAERLRLKADGDVAILTGPITSRSLRQFDRFIRRNPQITTLAFYDVPGSMDDEVNLALGRRVHELGLNTHAPSDAFLASGGVDLFLAGRTRTADCGAEFGVHSWATSEGIEGGHVPQSDPAHRLYLDYYNDVDIDGSFYWFTLEAAPADGLHIMTVTELNRYGMLTERLRC